MSNMYKKCYIYEISKVRILSKPGRCQYVYLVKKEKKKIEPQRGTWQCNEYIKIKRDNKDKGDTLKKMDKHKIHNLNKKNQNKAKQGYKNRKSVLTQVYSEWVLGKLIRYTCTPNIEHKKTWCYRSETFYILTNVSDL